MRVRSKGRPSAIKELTSAERKAIEEKIEPAMPKYRKLLEHPFPLDPSLLFLKEESKKWTNMTTQEKAQLLRKQGADPDFIQAFLKRMVENELMPTQEGWLQQSAEAIAHLVDLAYQVKETDQNKLIIEFSTLYSTGDTKKDFLHGIFFDPTNRAEVNPNDRQYIFVGRELREVPDIGRTAFQVQMDIMSCSKQNFPGETTNACMLYPRAFFDIYSYVIRHPDGTILSHSTGWAASYDKNANVLHFFIIEPNGDAYMEYWGLKGIEEGLTPSLKSGANPADIDNHLFLIYQALLDGAYMMTTGAQVKTHLVNRKATNVRFGWCMGMSVMNVLEWKRRWHLTADVNVELEWGVDEYGRFNETIYQLAKGYVLYTHFLYQRSEMLKGDNTSVPRRERSSMIFVPPEDDT